VILPALLGGARRTRAGDVVQSGTTDSGRPDMTPIQARTTQRLSADELASLVTHELRNPLNAMSGWLHLLSADAALGSEAAQRAVAGLRRALDQQVTQIDTLGRVLRLSTPNGTFGAREPVDLARLVTDSVEALRPAAHAAGREVVSNLPPDADTPWVLVDRSALHGALLALGRYGLRHGMPSAPLRVDLAVDHDGAGIVRLGIDEGDGTGRSIWSAFGTERGTRLALDLLHAALEIESVGGRIGPRGDGRIGDVLEIGFPPFNGAASARAGSGARA
jgi:phosphoglycerate-specific signal transduction histidine kinase